MPNYFLNQSLDLLRGYSAAYGWDDRALAGVNRAAAKQDRMQS
ncbi:Uncharacterized protein ChrSV_4077 [Chromobacterium vaccinii]|nr:Uncharacterized protein ChrSW_4077 [Chromobacterium vaccinii]QND91534.1 Uncharacterized protein ChrSV_4077 [Chromobacterium vaccinii]